MAASNCEHEKVKSLTIGFQVGVVICSYPYQPSLTTAMDSESINN